MYKVAVVNSHTFGRWSQDLLAKLQQVALVEYLYFERNIRGRDLAKALEGYQFVVVSSTPTFDREFFEENRSVVLIARHGVGIDNVDIKSATENGVLVTFVPSSKERDAVAELTIALLLSVVRKVYSAYTAVKDGRWSDRGKIIGFNVTGKKIGIIGFGSIGRRVAEILIKGFNANILVYDPYVDAAEVEKYGARKVNLEDLLRESDIISIHVPLTPETHHLISKKELSMMKDGVIIINTARGEIIDTQALLEMLESGKVGGVGLDVVEGEPIGKDHPLLKFENVVITPHIGAYTLEGLRGMDEACIEAILSVINRKLPPREYIANPDVLKRGLRVTLSQTR